MGVPFIPQTLAFAGKIFDIKTTTDPLVKMTSFKPSFPWTFESSRLERVTPETEGVSSAHIQSFLKKIAEDRTLNIHNVAIVRNGRLLCEASFGSERTDVWKYSFSACKSVVSLAIGCLIDDGALALDDRVVDIFPKEIPPLSRLKVKDLTIEDLLTMRSPVSFAELDSAVESDWFKGYFSAPTKGDPGEEFRYNSLNTYILSCIICKKTGQSLSDFLQDRLFSHLGIARSAWYWETCPRGIEKGGWGLYIYQEDFCKIAQLVMQDGVWNGNRLISEEYLKTATAPHVRVETESSLFDYGYHIWVGKQTESFLFNGMLGQNVIGLRNNGIIVACNAGNGEFFQQSNYFNYLAEYFSGDFSSSLPQNPKAEKALKTYVCQLSNYYIQPTSIWKRLLNALCPRKKTAETQERKTLVGQRFSYFKGHEKSVGLLPLALQMVHNCYSTGFKELSFEEQEGEITLHYEEQDSAYNIPLGWSSAKITELSFGENRFLVAALAKFKRDEDDRRVLVIRIDFLEFPSSRILKLVFLDDEIVLLRQEELPGKDFAVETVREYADDFADKPLFSGVMGMVGIDFFECKAEKAFAPELIIKRIENK